MKFARAAAGAILLYMAKPAEDDRSGLLDDPPADVQITIVPGPRGPTLREWIADMRVAERLPHIQLPHGAGKRIGPAVAAAAAGALVAAFSAGGGAQAPGHLRLRASGSVVGVVPIYGYPLGCLSVAIPLHDPRFARAEFDHALPCGRSHGHAVLARHRVALPWLSTVDADELAGGIAPSVSTGP